MARDNKTKGGWGRGWGLGVHGHRLVFLVYLRLAVVTVSLGLIRGNIGKGSAGGCGRGGRVLGDGAREGMLCAIFVGARMGKRNVISLSSCGASPPPPARTRSLLKGVVL